MTQKERLKFNQLIAEFMGWKVHPKYGYGYLLNQDKDRVLPPFYTNINNEGRLSDFTYHLSWDWLMPVVEKIETLGYTVRHESKKDKQQWVWIWDNEDENPIVVAFTLDKKNSFYEAVIDFIKWYNQH